APALHLTHQIEQHAMLNFLGERAERLRPPAGVGLRADGRWGTGGAHARPKPALRPRSSAARGGGAGTSSSISRTNADSSSRLNAALWRRSKPMVEVGLPLSRRPHSEPEKAPGNTST